MTTERNMPSGTVELLGSEAILQDDVPDKCTFCFLCVQSCLNTY